MEEEQCRDLLTAAYMAEVESRHRHFTDDGETSRNIAHLARFLTSPGAKFGMMLCGLCGNGKTTLLRAMQSSINFLNDRRAFSDKNTGIRIADAKEIAMLAKDRKAFGELRDLPMLAIEDMGREPAEVVDFGNVINPVVDLIEHRYAEQLFTAITTNLTGEQLTGKYGRRVADRFNEMLEVIVFRNPSYRGCKT